MNFTTLKQKQRAVRDGFPDALGLRVHRALSWLNKAEQCKDDPDSEFIFLWISFNAAYAQNLDAGLRTNEHHHFSSFIAKLVDLDREKVLYELMWDEFASSVRLVLNNRFVFQPFWDYQSGNLTEQQWKDKFERANRAASEALGKQDTPSLLSIVLLRLYTLRNQLVHGGATWQSQANRDQVRDATAFLRRLIPNIINIMMDSPNTLWGDANYPVV